MKILTKLFTPVLTGALLLFVNTSSFAEPTLTGLAGLMANFNCNEKSEDFDPAMTMDGYFCGQIAFTENFMGTGEISVHTADILQTELFKSTDATFCINQLSLTYSVPILGKAQYFSFFMGTYESVGNDLFLQRHFGIKPVAPVITETWNGSKQAVPYEINGTGGSYLIKLNSIPLVTGLYIYKNDNNINKNDRLNFSLRAGTVYSFITADLLTGMEIPLTIGKAEDDALLKITNIYMNFGGSILIGNTSPVALLLQGGFSNLPIRGTVQEKKVESKDMYVLVENRYKTDRFNLNLTAFSLPKESVDKMIYLNEKDSDGNITNTLGACISVYTDRLYIKNKNYTFGFHVIGSFPGKDFMDVTDIKDWVMDADYNIKVAPFTGFPILNGNLRLMLQADISEFKDNGWKHAIEFNAGYKTKF